MLCLSLLGYAASAQTHLTPESESFIIRYRVNRTEVDEDILDNKDNLEKIKAYLKRSPRIDSIVIYSYASPEGGFHNNARLAKGRGQSAKEYFLDNLPKDSHFPDSLIIIDPTPENWVGLRALIEENYYEQDRERVLQIIDDDSVGVETKKWRLKQLNRGNTWRYILKHYMPLLRYSTWICVWVPPMQVLEELPVPIDSLDQVPSSLAEPVYPPLPDKWRTVLGLKTNLLYDAVTAVNYSIEVPFNERFSVLYEHNFPWWLSNDNRKCLQFLSLGGEARWWFAPRPREERENRKQRDALMGHYLGIYGMSGKSDIQWDRDFGCYQFEFVSAGLSYGFAFPISNYLNLEFSLSVGYARIPYQHYIPTDDWQILIRDKNKAGTLHYIGPTKAEISLVIPFRKRIEGKGGAR